MPSKTKFKCLNCNQLCHADARNRRHQRFCSKPECRRASKVASQRQWTERPENQNYFKGSENCERVRQWRKTHPYYRRNKRSATEIALQDILITHSVDNECVISPSELGPEALRLESRRPGNPQENPTSQGSPRQHQQGALIMNTYLTPSTLAGAGDRRPARGSSGCRGRSGRLRAGHRRRPRTVARR